MRLSAELRSSPVRLALVLVAALAAGLAALALAIGYDANRVLAARTEQIVKAELAEFKEIANQQGAAAVERAVRQRIESGALYRLALADRVIATGFSTSVAHMPKRGVFSLQRLFAPANSTTIPAYGETIELAPGLALTVAHGIEDQRDFARRLQGMLALGLLTLAIVGIAGGIMLGRALDRRLHRINDAAHAIVSGDLSRRIDRDGSDDEIDRLSANLNAMLTRIEELMQALREVTDNIAHDLKTPINRLRNTAEEALRGDAASQKNALGAVIEQADGIIQTFNALLQIARLEHGGAESPRQEAILSEIVEDVVDLYLPVAEDAKLSFTLHLENRVRYRVNKQLFTQAVANLVDNAIKYAGDPNRQTIEPIEVTVMSDGNVVRVAVADRGPGIAPQDRSTALKRFGRLDKSRSLPGTGLGLSLVSAIARLHGGSLVLRDNEPGLRAILELPANVAAIT